MTVSFGVSLFCGCGRVGVCWILGVGVWVGGLVVGAWGVAAELHCAGCMIVCIASTTTGSRAQYALLSFDLLGDA